MQDKRILVLLEDFTVRGEVIQYAVALAQRIGAQITLLMVLPNVADAGPDPAPPAVDAVTHGESILRGEVEHIATLGVLAGCDVVQGEPRSEFLKYMATHLSFHTAVWGGDPRALRPGAGRVPDHWFSAVRHEIPCPLVSPTRKPVAQPNSPKQR